MTNDPPVTVAFDFVTANGPATSGALSGTTGASAVAASPLVLGESICTTASVGVDLVVPPQLVMAQATPHNKEPRIAAIR